MKKVLLFFLLITPAFGQRYDNFASTLASASGIGNLMQAIPNATITVCNFPGTGGTPCTNKATTYTNQTLLTACSLGTQVVLQGSSTCQATGDNLGNFGFWAPPGKYQYCVSATNFTTQCYNALVPVDPTAATPINTVLYVGGNITTWSGSDIGAQVNSAIAALPSNGGTIFVLPKTGGGCYTWTTQIAATTSGQSVSIRGSSPNIVTAGPLMNGTCLNWTSTSAGTAMLLDFSLGAGGGTSPFVLLSDLVLVNNQCFTNGGCGSSATGVQIGSTNSGTQSGMVQNVVFRGWGTGITINKAFSFGMHWINDTWVSNTTGWTCTAGTEMQYFNGGIFITNGTGFSSCSGTQATFSATEFDSNTTAGIAGTCSSSVFTLIGNHLENQGPTTAQYIQCGTGGSVFMAGVQALDDASTSTTGPWFAAGNINGSVLVFSAGRTLSSNLFNPGNAGNAVVVQDNSPTQLPFASMGLCFASNNNDMTWLSPSVAAVHCGNQFQTQSTVATETTAPTASAGNDICYGDSTAHALKCSYNNASFFNETQTIGTGNVTTAGTAINTLTCQAQTGITVTGAATTDNVIANIGATLPATWQTGIVLSAHVTATNTVTVYLCNPTATATITPAATQVNVRVLR